jgi:hypothetical protein
MERKFAFGNSYKIFFIALMAIGLAALTGAIYIAGIDSHRVWANVLLNNILFLSIALFGVFFIVIHTLADASWHLSVSRVSEAMSTYIPIAFLLMLVLLAGTNDLYHWTHTGHLDEIVQAKTPYLNMPFFIIRMVFYFAGWGILSYLIRKYSLKLDEDANLDYLKKIRLLSAIFIVFFAITSSTAAWDWIMSIDTHWYSTLFGWYVFSSLFVSGIAATILIVLFLRKKGYMDHINHEHLHDLGKYLFAFSIFWAYLWFSQFLLIWYSNIPEETVYFVQRVEEHRTLFFVNLGLNFFLPLLVLMTRGSKRIGFTLALTSIICIIGHWLDFYLMVMPGVVGEDAVINWFEIGLALGYAGLFLFVTFWSLSKASLLPKNHPYLQETFDYDNIG